MILWKDFILDDVCGAVLSPEIFAGDQPVRRNVRVAKPSVMEGAKKALNQETSQECEPAGSNTGCVRDGQTGGHDLDQFNAATRKESGGFGLEQLRLRGA